MCMNQNTSFPDYLLIQSHSHVLKRSLSIINSSGAKAEPRMTKIHRKLDDLRTNYSVHFTGEKKYFDSYTSAKSRNLPFKFVVLIENYESLTN